MGHQRKTLALINAALCLVVAACVQPPASQKSGQPQPVPVRQASPSSDHTLYDIVESESILLIQVLRGGPLSRFGHNHVIGGPVISGHLALADNLPDSQLNLTIRLADLQVDRPQWRRAAGKDFSSEPSEDDIAGTRANMLGAKVLDVARFPVATAEVAGILGTVPDFSVLARITLKESTRSLPIPVHFENDGERITATGTFVLTQSDFGIEPFSVLLGAISVKDDLQIQYTIVASARP